MTKVILKYVCLTLFIQGRITCAQSPKILTGDYHNDSVKIESRKESPEPILIEETIPNEVGEWNMRFNLDYLKNDKNVNIMLPDIRLFFGLLRNLGSEISLPLIYRKSETANYGFGSISTSIKWLIINQTSKIPAVVLGFEVGFPTISLSVESEERAFEYSPYIAFLKDFGHLCVQGNLARAIMVSVSGGEKSYSTRLNVAFSYPALKEKLDIFAELNSSRSSIEQNKLYFSPGIKYYLNENHFFAMAIPVGIIKQLSFSRIIFQYQFLF